MGTHSPTGLFIGLGTSPSMIGRVLRARGSGSGAAAISASEYGCCGEANNVSRFASSRSGPDTSPRRDARLLDHPEIMRDEQIRQPEFSLQVRHQIQHLRLHRNVQRRDRLVSNDECRASRARAQCPAAGAARRRTRTAARASRCAARPLQQRHCPLSAVVARIQLLDILDRLSNDLLPLIAAGSARNTGPRTPSARAGEICALLSVQRGDVLAFEDHASAARLDQPQDQLGQGGFAATGLAHDAQCLAGATSNDTPSTARTSHRAP